MTTTSSGLCPICFSSAASLPIERGSGEPYYVSYWHRWECPVCGKALIDEGAKIELDEKHRKGSNNYKISAFTRQRSLDEGQAVLIVSHFPPRRFDYMIALHEVEEQFPKQVRDRLDRALTNLAKRSDFVGEWVKTADTDYPLYYADNAGTARFFRETLCLDGLISGPCPQTEGPFGAFRVTCKGLDRIAELERGIIGHKPRQAFVAMWFNEEMKGIRNDGLLKAIEDAGYDPCIIDKLNFLEDIDDRAMAEIRSSRFMVVDFSGIRPSVYFEAGFAEALGIPMIFTCRNTDFDKLQFYLRNRTIIPYSTSADLRESLKNKILALFGRPIS